MRTIILIFAALFAWAIYEPNLSRRRTSSIATTAIELSLAELSEKSQQQKKVQRRNSDVIPTWHRGKKKPVISRCNYFSTKPRDVRFSDHRKIRRMFNNA